MAGLSIGFVSDMIHSGIGGGVTAGERFVERMRKDHNVVVIGADADSVRLPVLRLPIPAMKKSGFTMARPTAHLLEEAIASVDVVHLQLPFWLSFAALTEARAQGKPVVAAFHVQPENGFFNVGIHWQGLFDATYRYWVKHLYNRADVVICPTPFAERKLRSYGLTVPTVVVTNGLPSDISTAGPRIIGSDFGPGKFSIVTAGRLAAEKHQDVIIEAVARSRYKDDIVLTLAGHGPTKTALENQARVLGVNARVSYLSREDLLATMRGADLFVHASEVELEGIAVLEAMGSGAPVLVAEGRESAASDFALNDWFRFPTGDSAVLTARIDTLLADPAWRKSAGEAYALKARDYDFEASARKLMSVYESLAHAPALAA